ncbi:C-C motif chemokine 13-like [Pempheris klunzingeri]|uniref:C-C motif chemokine 13-like n=1 Tax=Pempheris klunzingeri TaxID=3127111 RepID=UPI00397FB9FB
MASRVAALLLLGVVICAEFAAAEIAVDCCLSVGVKRLPLQNLESYSIQEAGKGCDIRATRFITKVGRILCVSHPDDLPWVRNHIKHLDAKKKSSHQ